MGLREAARVLKDAGELAPRVRALGHYLLALRGVNHARAELEEAAREAEADRVRSHAARDALARWSNLLAQATQDLALERDDHERRDDTW